MRGLSGLNKLVGFGLSMAFLAVGALIAIPAMVRSSGPDAFGIIVLGQNFGAIGAMVVAYGWGISGPAEVARGDAAGRLVEFLGSVRVRLVLLFPVLAAAAIPAMLLSNQRHDLAAVGAVVAVLPGLTSNWFFIGLARPYVLMLVETLPRVAFTVVGIVAMETGSDAIVGLAWQGVGLVVAFIASAVWILKFLDYRHTAQPQIPPFTQLIRDYSGGVASSIGGSLFTALPLVIVTMVAPLAQPGFALVDKLQRQIIVALLPIVSVLQGWVPRAVDPAPRARKVMIAAAGLGAVIAAVSFALGGWALHLLGDGQLTPSSEVVALMGAVLGLTFYLASLAYAVLATYRKMRELAIATALGTVALVPAVAAGAWLWGVAGALIGIVIGLIVEIAYSLAIAVRCLRSGATDLSTDPGPLPAEEVSG